MEIKRPRRPKIIFKKKNKVGGLIIFNFKTYYKSSVIGMGWYWHRGRQIDPSNRTDSVEINLYFYGQFNLDEVTTQLSGKRTNCLFKSHFKTVSDPPSIACPWSTGVSKAVCSLDMTTLRKRSFLPSLTIGTHQDEKAGCSIDLFWGFGIPL